MPIERRDEMNDFREYSDYLCHYGIKGQKWGERRYQNSDGSLTPEGRQRYSVGYSSFGSTKLLGPNGKKVSGSNRKRIEKRMAKDLKTNRDENPQDYLRYKNAKLNTNPLLNLMDMGSLYTAVGNAPARRQGKLILDSMLADYANAHLDDFDEKGRMRKK